MKRAPRHLHQPRPDRPDLWSQRWTAIAGACLLPSFFAFMIAPFFSWFPLIWAWSDGWSGVWVPDTPTSFRNRGDLYPPGNWRNLVPWLMAVPVLVLAREGIARWRGGILLAFVLAYLLAVRIPFFGWIELPLGGHDGDGGMIVLTGWSVVLGSACIAAGAHLARRHPAERRGWLLAGVGGIAMLCFLLMPIDGVPWVQTAMAHTEREFTGYASHNGVVDPVIWRLTNGPSAWTMQRQVLGAWVVAYAALGLLMLLVRRRWATTLIRWAGALFLFAYPISGIVAYRLAPIHVVTGSHSAPRSLDWLDLVVGSAGNGLMAAGQLVLAAVAIGTVAEAGLIRRAEAARELANAEGRGELAQEFRQIE